MDKNLAAFLKVPEPRGKGDEIQTQIHLIPKVMVSLHVSCHACSLRFLR